MSDLGEYLFKADRNREVPAPECLLLADGLLANCCGNLGDNQNLTSARLFQFGFGSWRAAVQLALSGITAQVPVVLRHALECAEYSYAIAKQPDLEDIWWNRHENAQAKAVLRNKKNLRTVALRMLSDEDSNLCSKLKKATDDLIDMGAHPNVMMFVDHSDELQSEMVDSYTTKLIAGLEARNSAIVQACGISVLMCQIYRLVWPIRFGAAQEEMLVEIVGQSKLFLDWHHSHDYS
ncbi:hypothetical protein [Dinoroseobacter shibae]|uniref:hypothetical protein n=1 Tax=Dinoroseobacter shibae TaxID=215813 RepID=UPI0012FED49E|nr:hypothetical protein [Dinoroseobacter shibae]URF47497.1 hypothetical protein M8008_04185 [Dinoroseobacter shibae]URF51808.1 hypothetical protein M8007_04185 [Dinoroseobacter shibae]